MTSIINQPNWNAVATAQNRGDDLAPVQSGGTRSAAAQPAGNLSPADFSDNVLVELQDSENLLKAQLDHVGTNPMMAQNLLAMAGTLQLHGAQTALQATGIKKLEDEARGVVRTMA